MKKIRKFLACLLIHCLLSAVLFGMACVYQKSYNTMHRETVRMAGVIVQEQNAEIQILHYRMPIIFPSEQNPFWYGAYLLTDVPLHCWTAVLEFIKNS
ncbi:MAG: hypothetical protein IJ644_02485 [Oscillospiraceae bacterium]|nr:hypothetical protein [Oscillospiraceae bacterium]